MGLVPDNFFFWISFWYILTFVIFKNVTSNYIAGAYLVGGVVVMNVWKLDLQLYMQSVPITTNVVISDSAHGEVYSM